MKISHVNRISAGRSNERGYVVMTLLAMLAVLLLFIMVNIRYLRDLDRELKLVEREQIHRLQKRTAKPTALVAVTNGSPNDTVLTHLKP